MSRVLKVYCGQEYFQNIVLKIKLDSNGKFLKRKWKYYIPTNRNETGKFSKYKSINFPFVQNDDRYFLNDIVMSFYLTSCHKSSIEVVGGTQQEVYQILKETRFPTNVHFISFKSVGKSPGSIEVNIRDFQSYNDLFSTCENLNSHLSLNKFDSFNLITSLVNHGERVYKRSNKFYSFQFIV